MGRSISIGAIVILISCIFSGVVSAQAPVPGDPWAGWRYLLGPWVGEGGGEQTGQGGGTFSFALDLQNKIMVRKAHSEYPATADNPATVHDDLMVLYREGPGLFRANYYDNEGHVINYAAEFSPDTTDLIFTSDDVKGNARFRLTYHKVADDTVNILFEIAPPGKPDQFTVYLQGRAHRQTELEMKEEAKKEKHKKK